jgi:hypothetical protein
MPQQSGIVAATGKIAKSDVIARPGRSACGVLWRGAGFSVDELATG